MSLPNALLLMWVIGDVLSLVVLARDDVMSSDIAPAKLSTYSRK